jgi:hypothetical protein
MRVIYIDEWFTVAEILWNFKGGSMFGGFKN